MTSNKRTCTKCGESKALDQFSKSCTLPGGLHLYCKTCDRARWKKARDAKRAVDPMYGRSKAERAKYYKDNPETKRLANARRHTVDGKRIYTPPAPKAYVPGGAPKVITAMTTKVVRTGQQKFRDAVLKRDGCCVVTGVPSDTYIYSKGKRRAIIQAAHIKPLKLCCGDEYWDLDNGLAMRSDIHNAFDHGLFTISDDGFIIPSRWVPDMFPERLTCELTAGQRAYLKGHREWTMKNWHRWAF